MQPERGWLVLEITIAAMQRLEADWRAQIGDQRFLSFYGKVKAAGSAAQIISIF